MRGSCGIAIGVVLAGLVANPAVAQSATSDAAFDVLAPLPASTPTRRVPDLQFRLDSEVALPGPISDPGPRAADGGVEIAVDGGSARARWSSGSDLVVAPVPQAPEASPSADAPVGIAPDGSFRVRALPRGFLVAEKRCTRCRHGWRRTWRLRVAGSEFAPPLVTAQRVYFGGTDNRVYAVKRRNGHRVWVAEVGGRVLRPLGLWRGQVPGTGAGGDASDPIELVLVVPYSGSSVVALDADSGQRVATFDVGEDRSLVGSPIALDDGRVAVARQSYDAADAALLLLTLVPASSQAALSGAGPAPAPDGPPGRRPPAPR